ncbi:MAG: SPOR domain-containing protein [Pigmentiphaga sp.]|nr:SPOR domain-containing protein [Pigmentiphaga sp.]
MRIFFVLLVLANLALFAAGQGFFGPPPAERGRDPERLLMELHPETIHVPNDLERQTSINAPTPAPLAPPSPAPAAAPETEPASPPAGPTEPAIKEVKSEPATPAETPDTPAAAAPAASLPPAVAPEALAAPTPPPASAAVLPSPAPVPAAQRTAAVETVCREWGSFTEAESKRARQWVQKNSPGVSVQSVTEAGPASWMVLVPPAASLATAQKTAAALGKQGIKDLFVIQEAGPNQYAISLGVFSQEKSARSLAQSLQGKAGRSLQVVPRPGPVRHWLKFPTLETNQQAALRQQAMKQFNREWRVCK